MNIPTLTAGELESLAAQQLELLNMPQREQRAAEEFQRMLAIRSIYRTTKVVRMIRMEEMPIHVSAMVPGKGWSGVMR